MNKLAKLIFAASAVVSFSASAQQDIQAKTPSSAYLQDSRGVIARSPFGTCLHSGYWTPSDSVGGCDGEIAKPVSAPAPAPAAPAAAPAPAPVSEKVTFAADTFFDFDKAVLKADGKEKLDDLGSKLKGMNLE